MVDHAHRQSQGHGVRPSNRETHDKTTSATGPAFSVQPLPSRLAEGRRLASKAGGRIGIQGPLQQRGQVGGVRRQPDPVPQQERPDRIGVQETAPGRRVALGRDQVQSISAIQPQWDSRGSTVWAWNNERTICHGSMGNSRRFASRSRMSSLRSFPPAA